jgi:hypothetical protein
MPYLYINLLNERDRGQLRPDDAMVRLQEHFPEAIVLPGDQLALSAHRAQKNLDRGDPADQAVVQKLWWDAQHLGPAYAFYIPAGSEPRLEGVVKRYQADFHGPGRVSEGMRVRIVAFLRFLIPAGMTSDVQEESDEEAEVVGRD